MEICLENLDVDILRPKGSVHTKTTLYETTIALYEYILC